ncbi:MAG TPA: hypothetical protein VFY26_18860 [Anaerolineales bacterium]|nr:hypothetical protein [Anaerolineales bacterium]
MAADSACCGDHFREVLETKAGLLAPKSLPERAGTCPGGLAVLIGPVLGEETGKRRTVIRRGMGMSRETFGRCLGGVEDPRRAGLTPCPGVDDLNLENGGLSFFDSVENMVSNLPFKPGDKYVVVDPKKLDGLDVILDNTPP